MAATIKDNNYSRGKQKRILLLFDGRYNQKTMNQEITAYVALDDINLGFPVEGHFIKTQSSLIDSQADLAIDILSHEDGPYPIEWTSSK